MCCHGKLNLNHFGISERIVFFTEWHIVLYNMLYTVPYYRNHIPNIKSVLANSNHMSPCYCWHPCCWRPCCSRCSCYCWRPCCCWHPCCWRPCCSRCSCYCWRPGCCWRGPMLTNVLADDDVLAVVDVLSSAYFLAVANILALAGVLAATEDVTCYSWHPYFCKLSRWLKKHPIDFLRQYILIWQIYVIWRTLRIKWQLEAIVQCIQ